MQTGALRLAQLARLAAVNTRAFCASGASEVIAPSSMSIDTFIDPLLLEIVPFHEPSMTGLHM